jgi:hypothetical protein
MHEVFSCRLQHISTLEYVDDLLTSPFTSEVGKAPNNLQIDLIDLQSSTETAHMHKDCRIIPVVNEIKTRRTEDVSKTCARLLPNEESPGHG